MLNHRSRFAHRTDTMFEKMTDQLIPVIVHPCSKVANANAKN